jgi:stage V sporulation protein R
MISAFIATSSTGTDRRALFRYRQRRRDDCHRGGQHRLREAILTPKYNFGAPAVAVSAVRADGALELTHDHRTDGRGLDSERAQHVLEYLQRVWRRPVTLRTLDAGGRELELRCAAAA